MSAIHKSTQTVPGAQVDIKLVTSHFTKCTPREQAGARNGRGTMTGWQDVKYEAGGLLAGVAISSAPNALEKNSVPVDVISFPAGNTAPFLFRRHL